MATLDVLLPALANRPGSTIRLWWQGNQVSETTLTASVVVSRPARPGSKARKAFEQRFVETSRAYLFKGIEPRFSASGETKSPIAESLSRVASANPASTRPRLLVAVSDCREFSAFFDFECGRLPAAGRFVQALQREQVLAPGSFRNTTVVFSFVGLPAVDGRRCPATLQRARQTESLWRAALVAAGAAGVQFADATIVPVDALLGVDGDSQEPRS